ncbi:MAG TPA: glutamate-cysteine ligase family protein [Actinomycetota bacterium]|nr:glutamate-cysteine ligase family protein [Actinomycetota bacterium]
MPASTRTLSVKAARDLVAEHAFPPTTGERVGAEIEWFTTSAADVPALHTLLDDVVLSHGSKLTFEPGGQVELSSPPFTRCADVCDALASDTAVIARALAAHGIALHAAGNDPDRPLCLETAERRYVAMREYFDGRSAAGAHMMCTTAAIHVNVDAGADAIGRRRWRLAHHIGPMLVASFANSPTVGGRPSGWMSSRMAAWLALDATRCAPALNGASPAKSWAEYALNANVMFIRTEAAFRPLRQALPFADWITQGHDLGYPTEDDLRYHLTTLFPPVRARGWIELRMIDMLPAPWWRAAIGVGFALLTDPKTMRIAEAACAPVRNRWYEAARFGLADPLLAAAARTCFAAAADAADRIGCDRATSVAMSMYREHFVERSRCPAAERLDGVDLEAAP